MKASSSFTPINKRFSSSVDTLMRDKDPQPLQYVQDKRSLVVTLRMDRAHINDQNQSPDNRSAPTLTDGMFSAKLLSKKAAEEALKSRARAAVCSPVATADDADINLQGLRSAQKLSQEALTRALAVGRVPDPSNNRAAFRQALEQSAERCASTDATHNGTVKKTSKRPKSSVSRPLRNLANDEADQAEGTGAVLAPLPLKHPLNASPGAAASPGFPFRRTKQKGVNVADTPGEQRNNAQKRVATPAKRRPRVVTFGSSPAAADAAPNEDTEALNTDKEAPNGGTVENCEQMQSPDSHGDDAQQDLGGDTSYDFQDSPPHSISTRDFSTQAAILMAQQAFQEELVSPQKQNIKLDMMDDATLMAPTRQVPSLGVITPFRDLRSPSQDANRIPAADVPISTQDLFNAASNFAFSTVKKVKAKKRASFAPSPSEDVDGSETSGSQDLRRDGSEVNPPSSADGLHAALGISPSDQLVRSDFGSHLGTPLLGVKPSSHTAWTPQSARRAVTTFSITPSGSLRELSYQEGQGLLGEVDINAAIDDAGSFLQTWDITAELKKSTPNGDHVHSSFQSRSALSVRN